MSRYRNQERLTAAARRQLPSITRAWLTPLRDPLSTLTQAALDPHTSDTAFLTALSTLANRLPQLQRTLDPTPLANALEAATGTALLQGLLDHPSLNPKTLHAGAGKGKRCGNSWIPAWKECKLPLSPEAQEKVTRYRQGISIPSPTGRTIEFGNRIADHIQGHSDEARHRFADLAEACAQHPTEIWQEGLRFRHIKTPARPGGRSSLLIVTRQISDTAEEVITFTKKNPRELKNNRRGRKIYPAD